MISKSTKQFLVADTIALIIYSLTTGVLSWIYEVSLFNYTAGQWLGVRLLFNGLRYPGARLCGKLTDQVRKKLGGESSHPIRRSIASSISLSLYQLPIYGASALIMGVPLKQVVTIMAIYGAQNILLGWWYSLILDWMRRRLVHGPLIETINSPKK